MVSLQLNKYTIIQKTFPYNTSTEPRMNFLLWLVILAVACLYIIPKICVWILSFYLRKFSFSASIGGFLTFNDVLFCLPIKMNCRLLLRIEQFQIRISAPSEQNNQSWIRLLTRGLQINILLRDDFEGWSTSKIELLNMIDNQRQRMSRLGLLHGSDIIGIFADEIQQDINSKGSASTANESQGSSSIQEAGRQQDGQGAAGSGGGLTQMLSEWAQSLKLNCTNSSIQFFCYTPEAFQEHHKLIDETNVSLFGQLYLDSEQFCVKYNCQRLSIPECQIGMENKGETSCDVSIVGPLIKFECPVCPNKSGHLSGITFQIKVPLEGKLQKQFANYELDVKVKSGHFNLSKAYLKRTINFFVHLDMLLSVIKAVRRLVFKQHYQDMLVVERVRRSAAQQTRQFFNYRDTVIPKRFRVRIEEDLLFFIEFPSKRLLPFLASNNSQTQTVAISLAPNAIFEMARTLKNSYYIQFSNKLLQLETNGLPSLALHDFKQEIGFTFMKEVTELPIKLSKLEVVNHISGSTLKGNLSPALFKALCEFYNYYKFGIQTSKFKYRILSQLKDKQFLLDNIIANSSNPNFAHIKLTATQVLDIYEVQRHVDTICNRFSVDKIDLRHSSSKIYGLSNPDSPLKLAHSHAADLRIYCQQFMIEMTKKKGTEDLILQSTKIAVLQEQILSAAQRKANDLPDATNKDQFSIFQARDFQYQKFIKLLYADREIELHPQGPRKNRKVVNKRTFLSKVQANFDPEFILDRSRDWLDYAFIQKHYNRKWTYKYFRSAQLANQQLDWVTDVQNSSIYAQAAEIIWCLSRTRTAIILFDEIRPVNFPRDCYQNVKSKKLSDDIEQQVHEFAFTNVYHKEGDTGIAKVQFMSSKAQIIHRKQILDPNLSPQEDQKIIDGENIIIEYESSKTNVGIKFKTNTWNMHIPNKFAFGGAFESLFIQKNHVVEFLKSEYFAYKRKLNFKFFCENSIKKEPRQILDRAFRADLITNKFQLKFDEDEMLQTFVNQNEISELLVNREIFCLKPKSLLNMLKQLKKNAVYDTYLDFQISDFKARYERPACYKDQKQAFAKVQTLDEGFKSATPNFFQLIKGAVHTYHMGYAHLSARSLHKPIFEWSNFSCKAEMLTGILNSQINKELFTTPIIQKIFDRFDLQKEYNRLLNKLFYDVEIRVSKLKICVQGQQTQLVSNDLAQAMQRLTIFQDVSRSVDPRATKLPFFDGIDQSRHKNHGQFKFKLDRAEIEVWPCRDFNRYSDHLQIQFLNLEYSKRLLKKQSENYSTENQHNLCLRAFSMQKLPLQQFETALMTLPLLEVKISTNYNKGRNCDHYEHLQAQNLDHYLNLLRSYSTKEYDLSLKVNIPSYGPFNDTKTKNLYLPLLMHNYVLYSPVPLLHYQRSHMKFIDEILREYVKGGKIDQSKLVRNKFARTGRQRDNKQFLGEMFQQNKADLLQLKVQAFISDIYVLFTDFDGESTIFDQVPFETLERQTLDPDEIDDDKKRDDYLTRYQGIILSTENLNFQTQIVMNLDKEITKFEANRSFFKNRFLRMSALNSKNLFEIRNRKLDHSRLQEWPESMDNFEFFCKFFGVQTGSQQDSENDSDIELLLQGFKTIFPQYILKNEQIQHSIDKANWRYETSHNPKRDDMLRSASIFQIDSQNCSDSSLNAFSFKETDTIALVERMEYSQDQYINMDNCKSKKENSHHQSTTLDQRNVSAEFQEIEKTLVRHLIDVKNIRFLYTQKIHELITHHLIKGMKFSRFRKTGYIDIEKQRRNAKRDFKAEYKQAQSGLLAQQISGSPAGDKSQSGPDNQIALVDLRNLEKVTYLALRLTNPQINIQNGLTKSQMLITSGHESVKVVVYAYSTPTQTTQENSKRMFRVSVNRRRGTVKTNIVKYELRTQVDQMDLFVAPTYINLEDPTFWVTPNKQKTDYGQENSIKLLNSDASEQFMTPKKEFERQEIHEEGSDYEEKKDGERVQGATEENENVLRKILSFKEAQLRFEILQTQYMDHLNPKLTIDFQLQKVACEMDGPSMWHFMSVFKHTLLARGEKSADLIHIENAKLNDLSNLKESALRDLIDKEVNRNMYRLGLDVQRPKFARKVQYFVDSCEFSFYNQNTKFAEGRIDKAKGLHSIFANKESKADIDIQRVSMLNLIDADEYRLVVFPHKSTILSATSAFGDQHKSSSNGGGGGTGSSSADHLAIPETMFKLRTRDKYVVVAEAPWRVYDQFEIFIYPTSIQLTRNFYRHFKRFFFENNPFAEAETPVHQQKKYDLMIPTKAFQKHLPQQFKKIKDSISIGSGSHHSGGSKRPQTEFVTDLRSLQEAEMVKKEQNQVGKQAREFQTFFRYLRMNEVAVSLSYHHGQNSGLNVKKLRIKMKPFLQYGKFQTYRKTLEQYESHCRDNLLKQTPNIITQLVVKTKEKIEHLNQLGEEDEETKKQLRLIASKRLLFGDFSGT